VNPDQYEANLHVMWREFDLRLDRYARLVAEGRCLDEARDFARFLNNSGTLVFFKHHTRTGHLKIDGALLAWKAREVELAVCDKFKGGAKAEQRDTTLESILHRLDLIAGHVAKIPVVELPDNVVDMPHVRRAASEG